MRISTEHPVEAEPAGAPLASVLSLFDRFHEANLLYCHWKSNEHLGASLRGLTDLDILVDPSAAAQLTTLLADVGVKRFHVKPFHAYPGIEDYVLFDPASGRMVHVHVHYQLTLGEKVLKGYCLPWADRLLQTRVRDEASGIYIADPNLELLLLVVRAALKLRGRDVLHEKMGRPYFKPHAVREFHWLAQRVEADRLRACAEDLVGRGAAAVLAGMLPALPPTRRQLHALRRSAAPYLDRYRLYSAAEARRQRWTREFGLRAWSLGCRLQGIPGNSSRTAPHGGLIVAVAGGDHAARTRLVRQLVSWLRWEIAVVPIATSGQAAEDIRRRAYRARSLGMVALLDAPLDVPAAPSVPAAADPAPLVPDVTLRLPPAADSAAHASTTRDTGAAVDLEPADDFEQIVRQAKRAVWGRI
jgi:hypothetical protein